MREKGGKSNFVCYNVLHRRNMEFRHLQSGVYMKIRRNIVTVWSGYRFAVHLLATIVALLAFEASATASIEIDSVIQRWPWNNKVDITYTVTDGQNVAADVYCRIVFTATVDGTEYVIDGVTNVGANASSGTHVITWDPPSGLKAAGCTMTATLLSSATPSGDDYMVIDLTTGVVSYEGLLATQDASNSRYNTATYKTDKMVLRKVPAGGTYPTGDNVNYPSSNPRKTWTTDRDYYIGVFPVTQEQYKKIYGSNPSAKRDEIAGNITTHRPVENVSWDDLRGSVSPTNALVPNASGTFLERLNNLTQTASGKTGFDLPTEVMAEIAERAGTTSTYYWGDTMVTNYVVCSENSGGVTVAVGSRLPNDWGLFDTAGNVRELCLDDSSLGKLADATSPFVAARTSGGNRREHGGGAYNASKSDASFRASYRDYRSSSSKGSFLGFRVAYIVQ